MFALLLLHLLLIATLRGVAASDSHETASATVTAAASGITTAPIFLPYYDAKSWSLVRGSVIASNTTVHQTTYTIFCPDENPPTCDLSLEFPFILVEGPDTVIFHGTYTSTYIADLACAFNGTRAATCSGYSSYCSGFTEGLVAGPTQVSWTSTFTGREVQWGVLTLAGTPQATDDAWGVSVTGAVDATVAAASGEVTIPVQTKTGGGMRLEGRWRGVVMGAAMMMAMVIP